MPASSSPYNPGKEWDKKWSTLDVAKANQMLDAIGLTKKDGEGFRVRTDNGERLRKSAAIMGPKRFTQRRTVSSETAMPHSDNRPSTSRRLRVNRRWNQIAR